MPKVTEASSAASGSGSKVIDYFIGMGFPEKRVVEAIRANGCSANKNGLQRGGEFNGCREMGRASLNGRVDRFHCAAQMQKAFDAPEEKRKIYHRYSKQKKKLKIVHGDDELVRN
ncbi:uncharacterized protein [Euphorbia lathyris]|uniref:uncharacterized protein n=1 Tax=Euphorbia lathyris TaxID=212925 RepID=UPI003314183C